MSKRAYAAFSAGVQDPGAINYFSDYYMPYFFSLISETERKLLRHPLLNQLRKYDQRTGSDLYQTLFFYLKNERGISKTAQEMNIHRSTLLHRLERIGELSGMILNDPDQRMHILLSYYLEKYETLQLTFD